MYPHLCHLCSSSCNVLFLPLPNAWVLDGITRTSFASAVVANPLPYFRLIVASAFIVELLDRTMRAITSNQ